MPQDKVKRIHLIYGIIAAVLLVALGVALIVACRGIYTSGPRPYTRDAIAGKLQDMSLLLYLNLVAILGGIVLNIVLPLPKAKTKPIRNELMVMQKIIEKIGTPNQTQQLKIQREIRLRRIGWIIFAILAVGAAIYPVLYLFNIQNFPGVDPTAEIMAASWIVIPYSIFLLGCYFIADLISKYSTIRQTAVYKQMLLEKNLSAADAAAAYKNRLLEKKHSAEDTSAKIMNGLRAALAITAICFIVAGIFNGSANDVLTKAIKICTECIGLG